MDEPTTCTGCGKPGHLPAMLVEVMRERPDVIHGAWHSVLCRGAFLRTARHSVLLGPVRDGERRPMT